VAITVLVKNPKAGHEGCSILFLAFGQCFPQHHLRKSRGKPRHPHPENVAADPVGKTAAIA